LELWVKEKGVARPMYWIEHDPLSAGKNYYVGGQGGPLFPTGRRPIGAKPLSPILQSQGYTVYKKIMKRSVRRNKLKKLK
jgi:hypothetical protein